MKYIENKKILNQLKMIKKTQEMLSKNVNKDQPQTTNEKYTSLWQSKHTSLWQSKAKLFFYIFDKD